MRWQGVQKKEKGEDNNNKGKLSGNCENLWAWILCRGCANHLGFTPEKARGPVQSSAEHFLCGNAATVFLCSTIQSIHAWIYSQTWFQSSCMSHMYTAWLQQKLAVAGPGSPCQFLFLSSFLQSSWRHLKIEKVTKLGFIFFLKKEKSWKTKSQMSKSFPCGSNLEM